MSEMPKKQIEAYEAACDERSHGDDPDDVARSYFDEWKRVERDGKAGKISDRAWTDGLERVDLAALDAGVLDEMRVMAENGWAR